MNLTEPSISRFALGLAVPIPTDVEFVRITLLPTDNVDEVTEPASIVPVPPLNV